MIRKWRLFGVFDGPVQIVLGRCFLFVFLFCAFGSGLFAQTVSVNWSSAQQTIDGFGAAGAGQVNNVSATLADFFYTSSGIDLHWYRMQIYPDLSDCEADAGSGSCVSVASGPTVNSSDLSLAQAAVARGAQVFASEWSPPDAMKSNGSFEIGGNMVGNSTNYTDLANIQTAFVTLMQGTYNVPIYAISPQNEPEVSEDYPSCLWTAAQLHDYVPYLRSALNTAGYSSVKIMVAEDSPWGINIAAGPMDDATTAADVGIVASHGYGVTQPTGPLSFQNGSGQHVWETEVSTYGDTYDGSITNALTWATEIHYYLTNAQVNYWGYWLLDANQGYTDNEALTDENSNIAKRAYAIGNWSRFVPPGWHRVSVANSTSLLVTAFTNSAGNSGALVAVNNGSNAVTATFSVGTTMSSSVVPYLTSGSANLSAQAAITVSSGSFSATVPPYSIETFSNSNTSMQPQPPTNLIATVH